MGGSERGNAASPSTPRLSEGERKGFETRTAGTPLSGPEAGTTEEPGSVRSVRKRELFGKGDSPAEKAQRRRSRAVRSLLELTTEDPGCREKEGEGAEEEAEDATPLPKVRYGYAAKSKRPEWMTSGRR